MLTSQGVENTPHTNTLFNVWAHIYTNSVSPQLICDKSAFPQPESNSFLNQRYNTISKQKIKKKESPFQKSNYLYHAAWVPSFERVQLQPPSTTMAKSSLGAGKGIFLRVVPEKSRPSTVTHCRLPIHQRLKRSLQPTAQMDLSNFIGEQKNLQSSC
ncbi:hypothetical protein JTE90_011153 [Oedothorax gibbosus]|uniref:Uncharacterized protein n=1 Tax=Oedothorax gibbosus TaxID=931172 RepID=A0AAV6U042_9ARAC|nr:hypothetical protein JTE90_011153 [Oedothorax gibbosus]